MVHRLISVTSEILLQFLFLKNLFLAILFEPYLLDMKVESLIETLKRPTEYSRQKINHIITVKSEEIYGSVENVHIGESKTNLKSKPKKEKIIVIKSKTKKKIQK
jgi:hypothetical protein